MWLNGECLRSPENCVVWMGSACNTLNTCGDFRVPTFRAQMNCVEGKEGGGVGVT